MNTKPTLTNVRVSFVKALGISYARGIVDSCTLHHCRISEIMFSSSYVLIAVGFSTLFLHGDINYSEHVLSGSS